MCKLSLKLRGNVCVMKRMKPDCRRVLTSATQQEYVLTEADSPRAPELAVLETETQRGVIIITAKSFKQH